MGIFNNNITTELSFETILQAKYTNAVRKAAVLCWAQNASRQAFEHMVKFEMCEELEPMLFYDKKYKFLHEDTKFRYDVKENTQGKINKWARVYTSMFFEYRETGGSIGFELNESVLISHNERI